MRKPTTRRELMLAAILAFLIGAIVGSLVGRHGGGDGPQARPGDPGGFGRVQGSSVIAITGHAEGPLVPGSTLPIDLSLNNPNNFDLIVNRLTVTVAKLNAPQANADRPCSTTDFEVLPLTKGLKLTLTAGTVADLSGLGVTSENWPAVGMINRPVNQDGCKGATLTLDYEATGTEARR